MPDAPPVGTNWRLVFADEFERTTLDQAKWTTGYWWDGPDGSSNYGNNELEWYVRAGATVAGGLLRLTARRQTVNGYTYTSGMVSSESRFTFQYGYAEARLRVPKGKGLWPAFWMAAQDHRWPPEIDVFEILGHDTRKMYMNHHWKIGTTGRGGGLTSVIGPDFSAGFHRLGVLWEPGKLVWYVDGVERHRATLNVPAETMYLIANLAVGGNWPGAPDATTAFPATYAIDWVRVWQQPVGRRIVGAERPEILSGGPGNDTLSGGSGDDSLIGGGGTDIALYGRPRRDFRFTKLAGAVLQVFGPTGTDRLSGIERVRFSDGEVAVSTLLAVAATR